MFVNQTNKIVWLVDTIRKADRISFVDMNQKWKENKRMSGGLDLSKRTLHKWIDIVFETFGIIVANEGRGEYRYYLENPEELCNGSMERWLFNTNSVSNALMENKCLHNRIVLEDVPSGEHHLESIMEVMKQNRRLRIVYHDYYDNTDSLFIIEPYILRLWHQRWYVVANALNKEKVRRFCLDRIVELSIMDETFNLPADFSAEDYFCDCYGIISEEGGPEVTRVRLKATAFQANYIRDLPLHESQQEIERNDEYSIFELYIRPMYDFYQEVLRMGTYVEVLEPNYMREELAEMTRRMNRMYNN